MVEIRCELKNEIELTQCVKHSPESVEEGLKIIDTLFKLSNGKQIDVLAVDKDNTLVIMELKMGIEDNQLIQTIGYYDWVLNNFDTLRRIFPTFQFESRNPRVILIAEDFTDDTILLAKYLNDSMNINLFRYIAVKHDQDKIIICNKTKIPDLSEIFQPTTEQELFNYIDILEVRNNVKKLVQDIRNLNPKVTAEVKNWWGFSIKYNGRVFGWISIKKKFINYEVKKDIYDRASSKGFDKVTSNKEFEDTFIDFKNAFVDAKKKMEDRA